MDRYLLTGGWGCIGRHIIDYVQEHEPNSRIYVIEKERPDSDDRFGNVVVGWSDALTLKTVMRSFDPTCVFHCGAMTVPDKSLAEEIFDSNVNFTVSVLKQVAIEGRRCVIPSWISRFSMNEVENRQKDLWQFSMAIRDSLANIFNIGNAVISRFLLPRIISPYSNPFSWGAVVKRIYTACTEGRPLLIYLDEILSPTRWCDPAEAIQLLVEHSKKKTREYGYYAGIHASVRDVIATTINILGWPLDDLQIFFDGKESDWNTEAWIGDILRSFPDMTLSSLIEQYIKQEDLLSDEP